MTSRMWHSKKTLRHMWNMCEHVNLVRWCTKHFVHTKVGVTQDVTLGINCHPHDQTLFNGNYIKTHLFNSSSVSNSRWKVCTFVHLSQPLMLFVIWQTNKWLSRTHRNRVCVRTCQSGSSDTNTAAVVMDRPGGSADVSSSPSTRHEPPT